jgi:hypothetical protein
VVRISGNWRTLRKVYSKAYPFTLNLHLDWQGSKIGLLGTAQLTGGKTARCLGDLAETRTPPRNIAVPNGVIVVTLDDDGRRGPHGFQGFSRLWSIVHDIGEDPQLIVCRGSRGARPDCHECRRVQIVRFLEPVKAIQVHLFKPKAFVVGQSDGDGVFMGGDEFKRAVVIIIMDSFVSEGFICTAHGDVVAVLVPADIYFVTRAL